jgi:hypothetical protein
MSRPATLAKWEPRFEIDDGFRLTSEPTLEALEGDIRRFYDFSLRGADMHMMGAFLCGVACLRARDMIPKAARGISARHGRHEGFYAWRLKNFPQEHHSLTHFTNFAERVFYEAAISKSGTLPDLESGHTGFVVPSTKEGVIGLMQAIGEVMDGKTMTEFYRSIKRMREAALKGGNKDPERKRRTKDQLDQARRRAEAVEWLTLITGQLEAGIEMRHFLMLEDSELQPLAVKVGQLDAELIQLCRDRRLKAGGKK